MEPREIEIAVGELEQRVDRLRVLYEQYFLGFEKLEPTVVRKDVDRRFAILRKQNIRNTALRYRVNVVTQKYNTYAMYWTRICRQIEDGTFKRHLKKAKERFGDGKRETERETPALEVAEIEDVDFDDAEMEAIFAGAEAAAAPISTRAPEPPRPPTPSRPEVPSSERFLRPAPAPPGGRPRIVRKVVRAPDAAGDAAPRPTPAAPAQAPAPAPAPARPSPAAPAAAPGTDPSSSRRMPAAAPGPRPMIRPAVRPAAPSSPDLGGERPARPRPPMPSTRRDDEKA